MLCVLAIIFALCAYLYFYKITKDSLNPFGISIFMYMACYGINTLNLSIYQENMLFISHIIALLPMISIFLIGMVICTKHKPVFKADSIPMVSKNYIFFMWFFSLLSMGCVAYLNLTRGVIFKIDIGVAGALNERKYEIAGQVYSNSGIIGKFAQIYPYTMVFIAYDFIFRTQKRLSTKIVEIVYCIFCVIYTLFVLASRGTLLLSVVGILYLLNKKYHFSAKKLAMVLLGIIIAFSMYMEIRVISDSVIYSGTSVSNRMFNSIYNYFVLSFNNFDQLVRQGSPYTGIQCTLKSLSKILGIYNESNLIYHKTFIFNEELFIYSFYHDLGILGVIIWPVIIYFFIGNIYIYSKKRKPEAILLLAMYGKAIMVLPFGNYFVDSISLEMQYYLGFVLLLLGYRFKQIIGLKTKLTYNKYIHLYIRGNNG